MSFLEYLVRPRPGARRRPGIIRNAADAFRALYPNKVARDILSVSVPRRRSPTEDSPPEDSVELSREEVDDIDPDLLF